MTEVAQARYRLSTKPDAELIKAAVATMKRAERPVIYGGGGIINSGPRASALLQQLVEMTGCLRL